MPSSFPTPSALFWAVEWIIQNHWPALFFQAAALLTFAKKKKTKQNNLTAKASKVPHFNNFFLISHLKHPPLYTLCTLLFKWFALLKRLLYAVFNVIRLILWETVKLLTSDFRELSSLSTLLSNNNNKKIDTIKQPFSAVRLFWMYLSSDALL